MAAAACAAVGLCRVPAAVAEHAACPTFLKKQKLPASIVQCRHRSLQCSFLGCPLVRSRHLHARQHLQTSPQVRCALAVADLEDEEVQEQAVTKEFSWGLTDEQQLTASVTRDSSKVTVILKQSLGPMLLHWGCNDWAEPLRELWPKGTNAVDGKAVQTPFVEISPGQWELALDIPANKAPSGIVFVLKVTDSYWINNGSQFGIALKDPGMDDIVNKVLSAESEWSNWSLFNRFIMVNEVLDGAADLGAAGMAFILTWLRLSSNKQLAWYRNSNYQSKDIAWVQKTLAERMHGKARSHPNPDVRRLARMAMGTLPRGGGDAEQIRMGILHIMRRHGIREGHRPGIEDKFLEQWHQKLHTNTTPEDIAICEAYLTYLHTANMDEFYRVLWDSGGVSRERLATMDHPITSWPVHLPHMIPDFQVNVPYLLAYTDLSRCTLLGQPLTALNLQHFLWILKGVHAGTDMDTMVEMSKGSLDGELQGMLYDILGNRDAWWAPGKIVETRKRLENVWRSEWSPRDTLLLDISLDNYFGLSMARIDKSTLSGDSLVDLIGLVLENGCIGAESVDIAQCLHLWNKIKSETRWSKEWSLKAKAAADRIALSLQTYMDGTYALVQPYAEQFGQRCNINQAYIANFGEEVVRGQPLFNLSIFLQRLDPMLRKAAGLSNWQIVSQQRVEGAVEVIDSLGDVQGKVYKAPTVLIARQVGGTEDVPENVTAVLTTSSVDILSHLAIRARNGKVLLASCYDAEAFDQLQGYNGKHVAVDFSASGDIIMNLVDAPTKKQGGKGKTTVAPLALSRPQPSQAWAISEREFAAGVVGGKSHNLSKLRGALAANINLPASIALPFGTFERVLKEQGNKRLAGKVSKALERMDASKKADTVPKELSELRAMIGQELSAPAALKKELTAIAEKEGLIAKGGWEKAAAWNRAWNAIRQVWASKWTDRAYLSRRARSVPEDSLVMACLLQRIIPADYAFVIHTQSPVQGHQDELFAEVVVGLGETLVGNHPGRALSFAVSKKSGAAPEIVLYPSKRTALFGMEGSLIARSDSNGEDLEAFAGAGLYESVLVHKASESLVDYAGEPLFWDPAFQATLLQGITELGLAVEKAFGGVPQDVEGVYSTGVFTVVQSRPQIV
eukprot:jgi/Chlat1/8043/Chrsp73S00600